MANQRIPNISVENARIIFRNFAGKESKFNARGKRNFCLVLDNDVAEDLKEIGWNIKYLSPRDPDDQPQAYLQVAVAFDNFPPKIWLISGGKKTELNEDTIAVLDYAEIENVDVIVRPYVWEVNGKGGVKAYVKNMYVTIVENEFEKKYRNLDEDDTAEDCPF
jgi:hypothetical protein